MYTTSDRFDTCLILSRATRSNQHHESTMVWCNVPLYHLLKCLLPLCHALFVEKGKTKYQKRCYRGTLRQTMVDSWYCLDRVVPELMSQVSRWLEVAYINSVPSTPGYLLALLRELSQCLRALTEITKPKQVRKMNLTRFWYQFKKGFENRSSRFEPNISWISFSRGSGPPLSSNLQAQFCKLYPADFSVAIYLF